MPTSNNNTPSNPRIIPIPVEIHGMVKRLLRDSRWTTEMIRHYSAEMLIEIQRACEAKKEELWNFIMSKVPETRDYSFPNVDPTSLLVTEMAENKPTGRSAEIPEVYREEVLWHYDEIEAAMEASILVGGFFIGMQDKVDKATMRLNMLLSSRIPECATGTWQVDPARMVVVEGLPGELQASSQNNEGSSAEN